MLRTLTSAKHFSVRHHMNDWRARVTERKMDLALMPHAHTNFDVELMDLQLRAKDLVQRELVEPFSYMAIAEARMQPGAPSGWLMRLCGKYQFLPSMLPRYGFPHATSENVPSAIADDHFVLLCTKSKDDHFGIQTSLNGHFWDPELKMSYRPSIMKYQLFALGLNVREQMALRVNDNGYDIQSLHVSSTPGHYILFAVTDAADNVNIDYNDDTITAQNYNTVCTMGARLGYEAFLVTQAKMLHFPHIGVEAKGNNKPINTTGDFAGRIKFYPNCEKEGLKFFKIVEMSGDDVGLLIQMRTIFRPYQYMAPLLINPELQIEKNVNISGVLERLLQAKITAVKHWGVAFNNVLISHHLEMGQAGNIIAEHEKIAKEERDAFCRAFSNPKVLAIVYNQYSALSIPEACSHMQMSCLGAGAKVVDDHILTKSFAPYTLTLVLYGELRLEVPGFGTAKEPSLFIRAGQGVLLPAVWVSVGNKNSPEAVTLTYHLVFNKPLLS